MGFGKYQDAPRIPGEVANLYQQLPDLTPPFSVVQHYKTDAAFTHQGPFTGRFPSFLFGEAFVYYPEARKVFQAFELNRAAYENGLPMWSYQMFRNLNVDYIIVKPEQRKPEYYPEKYQDEIFFEQVYDQNGLALYKLQPLPLEAVKARFGPTPIEFMGSIIDEMPVYPAGMQPQSPQALVTAWRLLEPVEEDYVVFVHFVAEDGQIIGQADHALWAWTLQREQHTSGWQADVTYLDMVPIPETVLETEGPVTVRIGLWLPETGQSLTVVETADLTVDEAGRLIIDVL